MRTFRSFLAVAVTIAAGLGGGAPPASADAPSGAIFTTVADGSEVNFNHYASKEDVYLDGGPGPGAPQDAAGLDDGTYVFQVTDPSGKALLSQDTAGCRQFTVSDGVITGVAPAGACAHLTGADIDHGATTVQLFPYLDTPNNGGVYKAWVTRVEDFLAGCAALGVANGLAVVDCGSVPGNRHGFVSADSKTDNFKVREKTIVEIDTRFRSAAGDLLDGYGVTWTDTQGGQNRKWSYWAPYLSVFHEAHVEAVEAGLHLISITNQPGCTIHDVWLDGAYVGRGSQTVGVKVRNLSQPRTYFVDVTCDE